MATDGRVLLALMLALLVLAAPASAAPGWTPKESLPGFDPSPQDRRLEALAADDGTLTVVYTRVVDGRTVISAIDRPPGGPLSAPKSLSSSTDDCAAPSPAINRRGDIIVVWQCTREEAYRLESAFRPAGGAWQPAVPVTTDSWTTPMLPRVTLTADAEAVAIWLHHTGTRTAVRTATRPPGGIWGSAENISNVGTTPTLTALTGSEGGALTAAWIQTRLIPGGGTVTEIQTATRPPHGAWALDSAPLATLTYPSHLVLATGATGRVALGYVEMALPQSVLGSVRDPGGSWTPPEIVGGQSPYNDPIDIAVDDAGTASLAFVTGYGSGIRASRLTAFGAWSAGFDMAQGSFSDSYRPTVAAGAGARTIASWHGDNMEPGKHLQAAVATGTGGWSVPQDLDTTPSSPSADTAIDGRGNGVVVWRNENTLLLSAYDVSPPDLLGVTVPAPARVGVAAAFAVAARDRWSALQSIVWDFGDGTQATGPAPTHTYTATGNYRVKVTATDVLGNAASAERTVLVQDPPPVVVQDPPMPEPTPVISADPTGPPPPAATPTPTPTPIKRTSASKPTKVTVTIRSGFGLPAKVSPKIACGSSVGLTLRKQKRVLAKGSVKLRRQGRSCRFRTSFTLTRSKVGSARTLRCTVRYRETKALGGRTWEITVKVT